MDGCVDGQRAVWVGGHTSRKLNGQTDRGMDRQRDGQTDGPSLVSKPLPTHSLPPASASPLTNTPRSDPTPGVPISHSGSRHPLPGAKSLPSCTPQAEPPGVPLGTRGGGPCSRRWWQQDASKAQMTASRAARSPGDGSFPPGIFGAFPSSALPVQRQRMMEGGWADAAPRRDPNGDPNYFLAVCAPPPPSHPPSPGCVRHVVPHPLPRSPCAASPSGTCPLRCRHVAEIKFPFAIARAIFIPPRSRWSPPLLPFPPPFHWHRRHSPVLQVLCHPCPSHPLLSALGTPMGTPCWCSASCCLLHPNAGTQSP